MKSILSLFFISLAFSSVTTWAEIQSSDSTTPMNLESKPHHTSAEMCKACHLDIYNQWKGSMHAKSTALSDPIHGAFYQFLMGDPRQEGVVHKKSGSYPVCLKCHAPAAARDKSTKLDALPVYDEGVNCVTCHTAKTFKGVQRDDGKMNLGVDAYETADILQAPSGKVFTQVPPTNTENTNTATPTFHVYPTESNVQLLKTTDVCMGCHDRRNNANGVPVCVTGSEFAEVDNFNCQQCHMPVISATGLTDHSMMGGHSQAILERSVLLTLATEKIDNLVKATVNLQNMTAHNVPTGAPFRNMYLKVTAYDSKDLILWENFKTHPIKEDQKSILMLRLLDENGKPTSPPQATQLGKDSRLKPKENRAIVYEIPADNVAKVRVELFYDLLLPPFKQKFPEIPADLKKPRVVARAEQRI